MEALRTENWMIAQGDLPSIPGPAKIREARLLLVGDEDDFKGGVAGELTGGSRLYIAEKTATLLGALARLSSEAIDVVLLSQTFRDEDLALFTADARRGGFQGLILRVASLDTGLAAKRSTPGWASAGRAETSVEKISFTDRQRAVLELVSQGWSNRKIAKKLQCSEASIKAVLQDLFRKLKVRKRAHIVRVAMEKRLIAAGERPAGLGNRRLGAVPGLKDQQPLQIGDFVIDVAMHQAWVRGVEIHLTPSEFQLLCVFALNSGKLLRSSTLRDMFWRNPTCSVDALRVLVGTLRAKIETGKIPRYVLTERALGYRFIPSPSESGAKQPPECAISL